MGILGRISRIVKANVQDLTSEASDPSKGIDDLLTVLRTERRESERQLASARAQLARLQAMKSDAEAKVGKLSDEAIDALRKGDEDLARRTLVRKKAQADAAASVAAEIEEFSSLAAKLGKALGWLDARIAQISVRKGLADARSAQANVARMMDDMDFDSLEDSIDELTGDGLDDPLFRPGILDDPPGLDSVAPRPGKTVSPKVDKALDREGGPSGAEDGKIVDELAALRKKIEDSRKGKGGK